MSKSNGENTGTSAMTIEHKRSSPCSIELSRNAKGEPSWSIKLYSESNTIEEAIERIKEIDESFLSWKAQIQT